MSYHLTAIQRRTPDHLEKAEAAIDIVHRAVKSGIIIKPDVCSVCHKEPKGLPIEGHHEDYAKPLEVVWVCRRCHQKLDRAKRKREGLTESKGYNGSTIKSLRLGTDICLQIEALVEETGFSFSEVVRGCILRALPYVVDFARKKAVQSQLARVNDQP